MRFNIIYHACHTFILLGLLGLASACNVSDSAPRLGAGGPPICETDSDCNRGTCLVVRGEQLCQCEQFYDGPNCGGCIPGRVLVEGECVPDTGTNVGPNNTPTTCESTQTSCGEECCDSASETCVENACQTIDVLGEPCTNDQECLEGNVCITEEANGWSGGYCTRGCSENADCPTGNCWIEAGLCLNDCADDSDCRSGYECFDDGGDEQTECRPVANGTGAPGVACDRFDDCGGGREGLCIAQVDFPAGYCSESCSTDSECPGGSHCYTDSSVCLDSCTASTECRNGYGCRDLDGDGRSECWPSATGTGVVGAPCAELQDCAGGEFGVCIRPNEEDPNGWPDGYCTVRCGPDQATCSGDGVCFDPNGTGDGAFCLDACMSDTDCRAGYACGGLESGEMICS